MGWREFLEQQEKLWCIPQDIQHQECHEQLNNNQRWKLEYLEDETHRIAAKHCLYFSFLTETKERKEKKKNLLLMTTSSGTK